MAPKEKPDEKKKKATTSADKALKEKKTKDKDTSKEKKPSSKDKPPKDEKDTKPLKSSKGAALQAPSWHTNVHSGNGPMQRCPPAAAASPMRTCSRA